MQDIISGLREHLKMAYQGAEECDAVLEQLSEAGMANFKAIFPAEAGFETESDRLKPYVEEVAKNFLNVSERISLETAEPAELEAIAKKLEKIFSIQQEFSQSLDAHLDEK